MIGYLEGVVEVLLPDGALLLTAGGVGYQVRLPLPQLRTPLERGGRFRCYTVTVVRDDELSLYGFESLEGKALFELLITVSGVGPKVALALLSAFSPDDVREAIVRQDVARLATIPGIGKKTAQRLCVELSDRLARDFAVAAAGAPDSRGELISALTNLGFPEKDVIGIIPKLPADLPSFSEQLKQALNLLGKR